MPSEATVQRRISWSNFTRDTTRDLHVTKSLAYSRCTTEEDRHVLVGRVDFGKRCPAQVSQEWWRLCLQGALFVMAKRENRADQVAQFSPRMITFATTSAASLKQSVESELTLISINMRMHNPIFVLQDELHVIQTVKRKTQL